MKHKENSFYRTVHTVSYGPSLFPCLMAQTKYVGPKKRGKERGSITLVWTKQMRLIRCLLYGYKHANWLVRKIFGPYRKLWTGKLTNQSLCIHVSHIINAVIWSERMCSTVILLFFPTLMHTLTVCN